MAVEEVEATLTRIADLLGVPAEEFAASERTLEKSHQTEELLDLWDTLEAPDRRRMLGFIRILAKS